MHVLKSFRPTNTQKQIMAMVLSAPTPKVAAEQISAHINLKAAREQLAQLGLLTYTGNSAALTDQGMALAHSENIADEGGQLTDQWQQLVGGQDAGTNSMGMPGEEPPIGGVPAGDPLGVPMESFSFLRELMRC